MSNLINEMIELYITLTRSGVRFYYGDDENEFGEVVSIDKYENGHISFTMEEEIETSVSLEDFRIYHSKENINLYDWEAVRKFDRAIEDLCEEQL